MVEKYLKIRAGNDRFGVPKYEDVINDEYLKPLDIEQLKLLLFTEKSSNYRRVLYFYMMKRPEKSEHQKRIDMKRKMKQKQNYNVNK